MTIFILILTILKHLADYLFYRQIAKLNHRLMAVELENQQQQQRELVLTITVSVYFIVKALIWIKEKFPPKH